MTHQIITGDCREVLRTLERRSIQCCVTSPPYWGLRDYGAEGQSGLEETPDEYVNNLVKVFRGVRKAMRNDGTLWLNLGDSYSRSGKGSGGPSSKQESNQGSRFVTRGIKSELAPKQLCGIPWRVAFALQADGWFLRCDIIWHKPNPMPESVTDRPTRSHEYLFLLTKSVQYYYDAKAIGERIKCPERYEAVIKNKEVFNPERHKQGGPMMNPSPMEILTRGADKFLKRGYTNKRSVWTVVTKPCAGAHFATFPPDLIEPCILAGCPEDGIVLDPFTGSGTTGVVSKENGRRFIGIELNPDYVKMAKKRIQYTNRKHTFNL